MPSHQKHRGQPKGGKSSAPPLDEQPSQAYDGPNDSPSRGRAPSSAGARPPSRGTSQTRAASQTRRDPARDRPAAPVLSRNVDFGGQAYSMFSSMPTQLTKRDGKFGKLGKKATIELNSHAVLTWPDKTVYQYDINIGSGEEKRGLIKAIWASKPVQEKLGKGFIFDGNKIGWSPTDLGTLKIRIDLDAEKGVKPRIPKDGSKPRENVHMVRIVPSKKISLYPIKAYLDGQADFGTDVLEGINFLDHLLRETPSKQLINLRRSYFARTGASKDRTLLDNGVEAMRGIYQSIRMAEGRRLVVNVDISHSCFWHESNMIQLGFQLTACNTQDQFLSNAAFDKDGKPGKLFHLLKRLQKNSFFVKHRGQAEGQDAKMWNIKRISMKNAKTHEFEVLNKETGKREMTNVYQYYLKRYNFRLDKWMLPLLETQKPGVLFPMELANMAPAQKYPYKLNEKQTANMIKFAVSRPLVRRQAMQDGLALLKWNEDAMLRGYNLKIDQNMMKTNARVLDPPEVLFGKGGTARPAYSGRWDLRGKVFLAPNEKPLKSWGIVVLMPKGHDKTASKDQVNAFKKSFMDLYRGHGGNIVERDPITVGDEPDEADAIAKCFQAVGNKAQMRPQMLMVILPNKSSDIYQRVKKNCDCRFGVMSQCVQAQHVMKNAPQYCSNVLMKFNCKLGGTTSALKTKTSYFTGPTMIIGADVSHAAPGLEQASMAAMTMSLDKTCSRYGAAVQSNGSRVEMITGTNISEMLTPLIDWWIKNPGQGQLPKHVYYFRDGVSEGQYIQTLKYEVADIKNVFDRLGNHIPERMPKITVVIAEKRHHIRFFPPQGTASDKNGNPVPGVMVDRDVTTPFDNDIYLCSHAAIQGTARPTHYTIIMDEIGVDVDKFQAMLYEHCYQYQRATTPVSLFPAVYYAHLASKRGEAHIDMAANQRIALQEERRKHPGIEASEHSKKMKSETEWPKLMPFHPGNNIQLGMWFI